MLKNFFRPRMFWLPVFFVFLGAIMSYVMFLPKCILYLRSAKWERVEAQVLSASIVTQKSSSGSAPSRLYEAEYVFTYSGQDWKGDRASVVEWGPNPSQDVPELIKLIEEHDLTEEWGTALAWVNPRNPRESVLFRQWSKGRTAGTIVFLAMIVIPALILLLVALCRGWRWWLTPMRSS